ncbi:hypothetical protein N7478_011578 [Penicillium angulare]|uniref:uncharacterized protein n=1 Tax=Penicillium angulare TaxID=116970 RepID=UPI0025424B98|nr:uncharacterized protein N7478_011578 [Penicillium angulare]KAJ5260983.1 hypothetical protein N7478_011578 [Penicillium angulare]
MFRFMIFFTATYLISTEYISESKSKGEVLLFRRSHIPKHSGSSKGDIEAPYVVTLAEKKDGVDTEGEVITSITR